MATDKYLLSIPSADVTDSLGSTLDGEWPSSSSTYPSGNGFAGGNFNFLFNVLQGDANQDGAVTGTDGNGVRPLLLQNTTNSSYSPYYDLVGSGTITGIDGSYVRVNLTDTLPARGPSIPGGGSGNVVTAASPIRDELPDGSRLTDFVRRYERFNTRPTVHFVEFINCH